MRCWPVAQAVSRTPARWRCSTARCCCEQPTELRSTSRLALPFEERTTQRASRWRIRPGIALLTCSAEDLVVHKVFAGRDHDWLDVQGIVDRCGGDLDRALISAELAPLLELKDAMSNMDRLEEILERDAQ